MSRYIDANTAIKSFKDSHIEGNCYTPNFIVEFFEKQPTADVQEVKHGCWELIKNNRSKCSECGFQRNIETQFGWKFCPMCGADMGYEK